MTTTTTTTPIMTSSEPLSMATRTTTMTPLTGFAKAGPDAYIYQPAEHDGAIVTKHPGTNVAPDLIILCTWMGAAVKHIDKYTKPYQARYKGIPIVLIRSFEQDLMFRSTATQVRRIEPVVTALKAMQKEKQQADGRKLRVLLHTFSNGGCWSVTKLALAYKKANKYDPDAKLPVTAWVSDSAPSLPHLREGYNAMTEGLAKQSILVRIIGSTVVCFLLLTIMITNLLRLKENLLHKLRRVLNDPHGPFLTGVPRTYICSKTDRMVPIRDVYAHAADARKILEAEGLSAKTAEKQIQLEEFNGSTHVGHVRVDEQKYWKIVADTWSRVTKDV